MIFEIRTQKVFNESSVIVYKLDDGKINHIATDIKNMNIDEILTVVEFSINRLIADKIKGE